MKRATHEAPWFELQRDSPCLPAENESSANSVRLRLTHLHRISSNSVRQFTGSSILDERFGLSPARRIRAARLPARRSARLLRPSRWLDLNR